jgi:hypothetical protein
MARPKKTTKPAAAKSALLSALEFLAPAAASIGAPYQTHCQIKDHAAMIFNGTIAMGIMIAEDLVANPNLLLLIAALSKCKEETQIVQLDNNRLSIKSGKFNAYVPCVEPDTLAPVIPDRSAYPCNDAIKTSLKIVGDIAEEKSPRVITASVMLRTGSAIATNGHIIMEHWHGIDMPPLLLPKLAVTNLLKIDKKIVSFGVSMNTEQQFTSVTFWFADGSWFRTQLYTEKWPDVDKILNSPATLWPVPSGLWEALDAIKDFTGEENRVYCEGKTISTNDDLAVGANYEISGVMPKIIFNHKLLSMFAPYATQADFATEFDGAKFQGEGFRGALAKIT